MSYAGALEALDRVLNRGGEADDVLRAIVDVLHERLGCWIGIFFVEDGALVLGPERGEPNEARRRRVPVVFGVERVAELAVDGGHDREDAVVELHPVARPDLDLAPRLPLERRLNGGHRFLDREERRDVRLGQVEHPPRVLAFACVRTMFTLYSLFIAAGILLYLIVALGHY